jgi:hypothetical protein
VSDDVEPLLLQRLTENAATEQAMDGYLVAFRAMLMAEGLDHDFGPAYVHTVNHMCNAHPTVPAHRLDSSDSCSADSELPS